MALDIIHLVTTKDQRNPELRGSDYPDVDSRNRNVYYENLNGRVYVTKRPGYRLLDRIPQGLKPEYGVCYSVSGGYTCTTFTSVAGNAIAGCMVAGPTDIPVVPAAATKVTSIVCSYTGAVDSLHGAKIYNIEPDGTLTDAATLLGGIYDSNYIHGVGLGEVVAGSSSGGLFILTNVGARGDILYGNNSRLWSYSPISGTTDYGETIMPFRDVVWLDGYLFHTNNTGEIYNDELNDPTNYPTENHLPVQRASDLTQYILKTTDHIAAFGNGSTEFFYDAGNAVGSPLARRQDIFYNYGTTIRPWKDNESNTIYLIASEYDQKRFVARLDGFKISNVSSTSIDKLLNSAKVSSSLKISGLTVNSRTFAFVSYPTLVDQAVDSSHGKNVHNRGMLVYDAASDMWVEWDYPPDHFGSLTATLACTTYYSNSDGKSVPVLIMDDGGVWELDPDLGWDEVDRTYAHISFVESADTMYAFQTPALNATVDSSEDNDIVVSDSSQILVGMYRSVSSGGRILLSQDTPTLHSPVTTGSGPAGGGGRILSGTLSIPSDLPDFDLATGVVLKVIASTSGADQGEVVPCGTFDYSDPLHPVCVDTRTEYGGIHAWPLDVTVSLIGDSYTANVSGLISAMAEFPTVYLPVTGGSFNYELNVSEQPSSSSPYPGASGDATQASLKVTLVGYFVPEQAGLSPYRKITIFDTPITIVSESPGAETSGSSSISLSGWDSLIGNPYECILKITASGEFGSITLTTDTSEFQWGGGGNTPSNSYSAPSGGDPYVGLSYENLPGSVESKAILISGDGNVNYSYSTSSFGGGTVLVQFIGYTWSN